MTLLRLALVARLALLLGAATGYSGRPLDPVDPLEPPPAPEPPPSPEPPPGPEPARVPVRSNIGALVGQALRPRPAPCPVRPRSRRQRAREHARSGQATRAGRRDRRPRRAGHAARRAAARAAPLAPVPAGPLLRQARDRAPDRRAALDRRRPPRRRGRGAGAALAGSDRSSLTARDRPGAASSVVR